MITDLSKLMKSEKVDAIILHGDGNDLRYLTGFWAPDGYDVVQFQDRTVLLASPLEFGRAKKEARTGVTVRNLEELGLTPKIDSADKKLSAGQKYCKALSEIIKGIVGNKNSFIPLDYPSYLKESLEEAGVKLGYMKRNLVCLARQVKTKEEIKIIGEIQSKSLELINYAISLIENGERSVGEIKTKVKLKGFEMGLRFPLGLIVATGANAAEPHYMGNKNDKIKSSNYVVLDFYPQDAETRYWGDCSRTIAVGKNEEMEKVYGVVAEAQKKAIAAVRPGAKASDIHGAASKVIEDAGYETLRKNPSATSGFIHSTGHGIGLDIHEAPGVGSHSETLIEEGMVFSIEPGIYLPGKGGIRIEDLVVVTEQGCRVLGI